MNSKQRKLRREQIDALFGDLAEANVPIRPRGGWVQSIREALGMTLDAFGARLGVSRQTAHQLEKAEALESISVKRLRAAADALECELIVYLRPKRKLDEIINDHARTAARNIVSRAGHSMAMEDQTITDGFTKRLIEETTQELINRGDSSIWQWK